MPDKPKDPSGVNLETEEQLEHELFDQLGSLPELQPSKRLRRTFYRRLGQVETEHDQQRAKKHGWLEWLAQPLLPAMATLIVGLFVGLLIGNQLGVSTRDEGRIESLRAEVATLNATVALSLMQKQSAGERLRGVDVAIPMISDSPRITQALLQRAASDSNRSVRSAAIGALGPQLRDPGVASEVQRMMLESSSPQVQLAFAELVMRWGDSQQLRALVKAAEDGRLLADVERYVIEKVKRMSA